MSDQPLQLEYAQPDSKRRSRYRRRSSSWKELIGLLVSQTIWSFGALFVVGLTAGALTLFSGGPVGGFPFFVAGIVLIPTIAAAVVSVRRRRAAAVLGYLQQAIRLNLPLNRVLASAARGEKGPTAQRLIALKEDIECGLPLSEAIALAVPEMPMRDIGLIEYASKVGSIPQTLDRLVAQDLQRSRRQRNEQPFAAWYPLVLIAMVCLAIGMIDTFVAPKLNLIFHDFGIHPPEIFARVMALSDWGWILGPAILLVLLLCLGFQLRQTIRIQPPIWLLNELRGRILWRLPLLHRLILDRNMSDICNALADSAQLGYPLDKSLERLGQLHLNSVLQRRILGWTDAIREGMAPADAARQARMPPLLVGLMATVRDTAGLSEVFRFVGRFHGDRFLLGATAIRAAVIPVFTILMGIIVALVALSIFVPLQQMVAKYSW